MGDHAYRLAPNGVGWLVHEHIAEAEACLGHLERAEEIYRDVVERTDNPELIDALADVLEERGHDAEARPFRERADRRFEQQLAQLPEAAYGHALEHFLAHGTPERALEIAQANFALRSGGRASVRLAQALIRSGRYEDARARLADVLEGPYRSATLHATASVAARALGDEEGAAEQERLATAINPAIMDDVAGLAPSRPAR